MQSIASAMAASYLPMNDLTAPYVLKAVQEREEKGP